MTSWRSRTALRLHATLVVGLAGSTVASVIEWRRALSGHDIAWVYAFEWPLFAAVGAWVWWRLVHAGDDAPPPQSKPRPQREVPADDEQLRAWQDYLDRLHAADPPGGPPPRAMR